jgi:23S rRNA (guanosine2251-2'-O)-methyltransferase
VGLSRARADARGARDWKRADALRAELAQLDVTVRTRRQGTDWEWKGLRATSGVSEDRVYGRNPVLELARGARRAAHDEVAVLSGALALAEVVALARRAGVKVSYRDPRQLSAMAGSTITRAWWPGWPPPSTGPRALWRSRRRVEAPFFMVLDRVQDPRNFGAASGRPRSFGVHGVVVPKHPPGRG